METRASYILVGSFVLALVAAMLGAAVWFSKVEFADTPLRYHIYFAGDVTGLNVGSAVRYRGVPVGTVSEIRIDPSNVERTRVLVEVRRDAPIKTDTAARVGLQGLTGVAFIQLVGGTQTAAALRPVRDGGIAVIPSEPSTLQRIVDRLPEIIERVAVVADRLSLVFNESNREAMSATIQNLRRLTEAMASPQGDLKDVIKQGRESVAALTDMMRNLDTRASQLADTSEKAVEEFRATMADIRRTSASFNVAADGLKEIVEENRAPLRDFSQGGLYELSQFVAEARVLVDSLTRLSRMIERDPARFLFGDTQKGYQPK
jgi:phospholipid/cholesterol/gamma-HCH transport system substrate-binding protein